MSQPRHSNETCTASHHQLLSSENVESRQSMIVSAIHLPAELPEDPLEGSVAMSPLAH